MGKLKEEKRRANEENRSKEEGEKDYEEMNTIRYESE